MLSVFTVNMLLLWQSYVVTQSAFQFSLITIIPLIPIPAAFMVSGVLADKYDRRLVLIWVYIGLALATLVFLIFVQQGALTVWGLMITSLLVNFFWIMQNPVASVHIQDIVAQDSMEEALSLNFAGIQLGRMLAPAFAGFAVNRFSTTLAVVSCVLFFIPMFVNLLMYKDEPTQHEAPKPVNTDNSMTASLIDGIKFLLTSPAYLILFALVAVQSLFVAPLNFQTTVFASILFSDDIIYTSWLSGAYGAGGFVGILLLPRLRNKSNLKALVFWGIFCSVFLATLMFVSSLYAISALIFIIAAFVLMQRVGVSVYIQKDVNPLYTGRLLSLYGLFTLGLPRIGNLMYGYVIDQSDIQTAIALFAAASFGGLLLCYGISKLKSVSLKI